MHFLQVQGSTTTVRPAEETLLNQQVHEPQVGEGQSCTTLIQEIRHYLNNIQGITDLLPILKTEEVGEYMQLLAAEVRTVSQLLNNCRSQD